MLQEAALALTLYHRGACLWQRADLELVAWLQSGCFRRPVRELDDLLGAASAHGKTPRLQPGDLDYGVIDAQVDHVDRETHKVGMNGSTGLNEQPPVGRQRAAAEQADAPGHERVRQFRDA